MPQYPKLTASPIKRVPVPTSSRIPRVPVPAASSSAQEPVRAASIDTFVPPVAAAPSPVVDIESGRTQGPSQSSLTRAYKATRLSMQKHWVISALAEAAAGVAGLVLVAKGAAGASHYDDYGDYVSGQNSAEIGAGAVFLAAATIGAFMSCRRNRFDGSHPRRSNNTDTAYEDAQFRMGAENAVNLQYTH